MSGVKVETVDVNSLEAQKKRAALEAVTHIESGMLIGLGTGSTAKYAIEAVGERLRDGALKDVRAVVTSEASGALAETFDIPLVELTGEALDVAIDGMDELDPNLNAIKGLGGALTREKIVEACAKLFVLIGDETKRVKHLGERALIPVEVVPFGWRATQENLKTLGCRPTLRVQNDQTFMTDNGNYILDCAVTPPVDVYALAREMSALPGVVEHGLFLDMAGLAYVATSQEVVKLTRGGAA